MEPLASALSSVVDCSTVGFLGWLTVAISKMAGLDSPLGENEVQAGQPHRSGPFDARRPTEVELDTILVVLSLASKTKEWNEAGDGEVVGPIIKAVSPSPLPREELRLM